MVSQSDLLKDEKEPSASYACGGETRGEVNQDAVMALRQKSTPARAKSIPRLRAIPWQ